MRKYAYTNARDYDLGARAFKDAIERLLGGSDFFENSGAAKATAAMAVQSSGRWDSESQPGRKDNTSGKGNNADSRLTSKYNYLLSGLTDEQIEEADKIVSRIRMERYYAYGGYASMTSDRINELVDNSIAEPLDYAQSYIAWVDPQVFLWAAACCCRRQNPVFCIQPSCCKTVCYS